MSLSVKPSNLAVATTSRRAGKFLADQLVIADCIMSSVIFRPFSSGHRYSTSYPVRPATRPALRAGQVGWPCRVPSKYPAPQSFGLLSQILRRIVGDLFFMQPQGTCPRKRATSDHHARTMGGSCISNATAGGNHLVKPRRFRNLPIFSLDLTATSAALCIQHPDTPKDALLKSGDYVPGGRPDSRTFNPIFFATRSSNVFKLSTVSPPSSLHKIR